MHVNESRDYDTESLPCNIFCRMITICWFISLRWNIADIFKRGVIILSMLFILFQKVISNTMVRHHFDCDGVVLCSGNCIIKIVVCFYYSHISYIKTINYVDSFVEVDERQIFILIRKGNSVLTKAMESGNSFR